MANALNQLPNVSVNLEHVETNMVFATFAAAVDVVSLVEKLKHQDILLTPGNPMRLVTHLDIDKTDIDNFIQQLNHALKQVKEQLR